LRAGRSRAAKPGRARQGDCQHREGGRRSGGATCGGGAGGEENNVVRSSPRKRGPKARKGKSWIPACAGMSGEWCYLGGIWISSTSCSLVNSVAVNFSATASFTIVSSPVIVSGSIAGGGKKSSRVRLAFASVMPSQSA